MTDQSVPMGFESREPPASELVLDAVEARSMLREVHHRLTNTFAILGSLLRRDPSNSKTLEQIVERCERLMIAHSELHRFLMPSERQGYTSIGEYTSGLCSRLSRAILEPIGVVCYVEADDAMVPRVQCERFGLIASELIVNAAKHAFTASEHRRVGVTVRVTFEGWSCSVADNGCADGWETKAAGTGSAIVTELVRSLGGSIVRHVSRSGTCITVQFPTGRGNDG